MSDITKCTGGGCQLKFKCLRYFPANSQFQKYFKFPPFKTRATGTQKCAQYIEEPKRKVWQE